MGQFVLVHGMSHGAWAWETFAPRLERAGHAVIAVDLPGHGRRAPERRRASVGSYARAVADAVAAAGFHAAIVVGHSMGGIVIPKVAELVPARVGHLVFLAAVVLPHRGSLLTTHLPRPLVPLVRGMAAGRDGAVQYGALAEWQRWLGDLAPGDARVVDALGRMTPQPFRPLAERVDMRHFQAMSVPRTYIRCLRDAAVPPAVAASYAARLGVTPIDMDTAHEPMLSAPDELAAILDRIARG